MRGTLPYVVFGWGNSAPSSGSSYKRTHYFNEKVNQWSCRDTSLNVMDLNEIRDYLPASGIVSKKTIRSALRLMGRAKVGEEWIYIQCKLTGTTPPEVDSFLIETMKRMFIGIEIAFDKCKPANRKCMVHYNYIFVRILQILNKPEYFKYFPLLKSKTKVRAIDDVWKNICRCMDLTYLPLPTPKMFKNVGNIHGDVKRIQRGVSHILRGYTNGDPPEERVKSSNYLITISTNKRARDFSSISEIIRELYFSLFFVFDDEDYIEGFLDLLEDDHSFKSHIGKIDSEAVIEYHPMSGVHAHVLMSICHITRVRVNVERLQKPYSPKCARSKTSILPSRS